ncbi:MAG TPA: TetR/AcrR family transcriptional regulator [Clostridiaceae bacterium]|jgi:AcrR family transcriptional regulator|nr:TetR/AcrR family transcriptional regulator [Clostridiaceae bacterium]
MKEEQILNAAKKLFTNYGFKKVSMDEIASEAGVTKKTVYTYFSSKEELLKYCIKEELQNMRKIIENVESKKLDFMETVHQVIYNLLKYKKNCKFLKMLFKESEILKNEQLKDNLKIVDKEIQNYIRKQLELAIQNDKIEVQNIDITTFLIYKMYIALMIDWNEDYKKLDEKEIADNILHFLVNGLKRKEVEKDAE